MSRGMKLMRPRFHPLSVRQAARHLGLNSDEVRNLSGWGRLNPAFVFVLVGDGKLTNRVNMYAFSP